MKTYAIKDIGIDLNKDQLSIIRNLTHEIEDVTPSRSFTTSTISDDWDQVTCQIEINNFDQKFFASSSGSNVLEICHHLRLENLNSITRLERDKKSTWAQ